MSDIVPLVSAGEDEIGPGRGLAPAPAPHQDHDPARVEASAQVEAPARGLLSLHASLAAALLWNVVFLVQVLFLLLGHCLFPNFIPAWVPEIKDRPYLALLPMFTGTSIVTTLILFRFTPATPRWNWLTRLILILLFSICTSALVIQYISSVKVPAAICYLLSQFLLAILYSVGAACLWRQRQAQRRIQPRQIPRAVKLGRIWLRPGCCCAHHWAVQVGDAWYEVAHKERTLPLPPIEITRTLNQDRGRFEAGCCGGEIAGVTLMTDDEIEAFIRRWEGNPDIEECVNRRHYCVLTSNCIKFAYEFIAELTDGMFTVPHSSVVAYNESDNSHVGHFAVGFRQGGGNSIARWGVSDTRLVCGPFGVRCRLGPEFQVQAVAGPGFGAFLDASCNRIEVSFGFLWVGFGVHADLNLNTGLGARNGNLELHVLGFGGRLGADGLELNMPWMGGSNIMAIPIGILLYVMYIHDLEPILKII